MELTKFNKYSSKHAKLTMMCINEGLEIRFCTSDHWQIIGGTHVVNFYPSTNRVYIKGTHKGFIENDLTKIPKYANKLPAHSIPKKESRKSNKSAKNRLFIKQEGICGICKKPMYYHECDVDHIIPISKGGEDRAGNKQATHIDCNREKSDKI